MPGFHHVVSDFDAHHVQHKQFLHFPFYKYAILTGFHLVLYRKVRSKRLRILVLTYFLLVDTRLFRHKNEVYIFMRDVYRLADMYFG